MLQAKPSLVVGTSREGKDLQDVEEMQKAILGI